MISQQSAQAFLDIITGLVRQQIKSVYLLISTDGGQVLEGMTLYNVLRGLPFDLTTHNIGSVNSIGNVVFLAGQQRYASPTANFMFHGVAYPGIAGQRMDEKFLVEKLDGVKAEHKRIGEAIESRTGLPSQEVEKLFIQQAVKDATYAKANGFIHDIREVNVPPGSTVLHVKVA